GTANAQESNAAAACAMSADGVHGVARRRVDTQRDLVPQRRSAPLQRIARRHSADFGESAEHATARARRSRRDHTPPVGDLTAFGRIWCAGAGRGFSSGDKGIVKLGNEVETAAGVISLRLRLLLNVFLPQKRTFPEAAAPGHE